MKFEWQGGEVTFLSSESLFQGRVSELLEDRGGEEACSPHCPFWNLPGASGSDCEGEHPLESSGRSRRKDIVLGCGGRKGHAGFDLRSGSQGPGGDIRSSRFPRGRPKSSRANPLFADFPIGDFGFISPRASVIAVVKSLKLWVLLRFDVSSVFFF